MIEAPIFLLHENRPFRTIPRVFIRKQRHSWNILLYFCQRPAEPPYVNDLTILSSEPPKYSYTVADRLER